MLFKDHAIRLGVATFLSFLSVLMHTATEPFADRATNALALASHLLVFMVLFMGQEIAFGVVHTEDFGVDVLLVILLLAPPVFMVYSTTTQAHRDRIEDLRRREREVQAEEMRATLSRLKDAEDEALARDVPVVAVQEETKTDIASPPPPQLLPLASASISTDEVNFEKCSFPCYVMSLTNLCSLDQLPLHEDAYEAGLLQRLTLTSHVGIPTR